MSSMKDIKQRIENVSTTKQIMKAMDMVSTAKLQKARERMEGARAIYYELQSVMDDLKNHEDSGEHIFTREREIKNSLYIIITSDMGLCGSYNANICQKALAHMEGKNEKILVVGSKGNEFFKRHQKNIRRRITDVSEARIYEYSERIGRLACSLYSSGEVDEVFAAYTHFESTLSLVPRIERILPLSPDPYEQKKHSGMSYEPDINTFLDHTMLLYLHMYFFAVSSESVSCEHAARMVNMESASKNASEIIDDLTLMHNRKRQAAITQELSEIVGGASILK
jgi:F-type H+-transporting ATPase subunit gamma